MKKSYMSIVMLVILSNIAIAQSKMSADSSMIKIFFECRGVNNCDIDFLKSEMNNVVEFVRDRFVCDFQIILISQESIGKGEQNELIFYYLAKQQYDTLRYFNDLTFTEDQKRRKLLKYINVGLLKYIINKSYIMNKIQIGYSKNSNNSTQDVSKIKDIWNLWQFSVSAFGSFSGDQNYSSNRTSLNLSVNRETNKNRFNFSSFKNLNRNTYNTSPTEQIKINTDDQGFGLSYVKLLSKNYAIGIDGDWERSLYNNIDNKISSTARIEYSILPYNKFNSERVVLRYSIGPQFSNYNDTTIYLQTSELRFRHRIGIISSINKPWGNIDIGIFWKNFFHDFKKNNLSVSGNINWRIFKGLRFGIGGNYQFIRDQLSLPKTGISRDDLLTKKRIIATSYSYGLNIGLRYQFGSIYNSQIHPSFRDFNYSLNF